MNTKPVTEEEIAEFHHAEAYDDPLRGDNCKQYELAGWNIWFTARRWWACAIKLKLQNSNTDSIMSFCYHRYHRDLDKAFQFVVAVGTDPQSPLGIDLQRLNMATDAFRMEK